MISALYSQVHVNRVANEEVMRVVGGQCKVRRNVMMLALGADKPIYQTDTHTETHSRTDRQADRQGRFTASIQ